LLLELGRPREGRTVVGRESKKKKEGAGSRGVSGRERGRFQRRPLVLQFSSLPKEGWLAVFREPPELWFPYQGKGGGFKKMRGQGGGCPRFGFEREGTVPCSRLLRGRRKSKGRGGQPL
jgi:hypothetical protein